MTLRTYRVRDGRVEEVTEETRYQDGWAAARRIIGHVEVGPPVNMAAIARGQIPDDPWGNYAMVDSPLPTRTLEAYDEARDRILSCGHSDTPRNLAHPEGGFTCQVCGERFKTMRIEGVLSDHPVLIHPDGRREPLFVFGTWYPIDQFGMHPGFFLVYCDDDRTFCVAARGGDGVWMSGPWPVFPDWFMPLPPPPEKR